MPTIINDIEQPVLVNSVAAVELTLDPRRDYTLVHSAETSAGAASTVKVYVLRSEDLLRDNSEQEGKCWLAAGVAMDVIPPASGTVYLQTASGEAVVQVLPGRVLPPDMRT